MVGLFKLSGFQKIIMLAIYLLSFPIGLFAYGTGDPLLREVVVALSGLELLLAFAVSESKGEITAILLTMSANGLSEMVNVGAGNWSYAPGGGFINREQIFFISFMWGVFMWTAYNLAKITLKRKRLIFEISAVLALLVVVALTQPKFYFDPSSMIVFLVSLVPFYFFYKISDKLEQAFLLHAVFIGLYNEVSGILGNVWFWESVNGTNILTILGAAVGYSLPMWLLLKIGWFAADAKIH